MKPLLSKGFSFTRPKKRANPKSLYTEFLKEKGSDMQSFAVPYEKCKVYDGDSYWYISYYYRDPQTGKMERFKEYFDINRIKNQKEKRIYAQEIVKFIDKKLEEGFNPFEAMVRKKAGGTILPMLDSLSCALNVNATETTIAYYSKIINRLRRYIVARELESIALSQIDSEVAQDFKDWMIEEELTKKTINDTLTHLSLFWKTALKKKYAFADPWNLVDRVKKEIHYNGEKREDVYEPFTFEEVQKLMSCAGEDQRRYYMLIYYAWARPIEIRRLKVKDIIINSECIRFRNTETKNETGAFVQIVSPLMKALLEMQLERYNQDDYLFSDNYLPGAKPIHRSKMERDYLKIKKSTGIMRPPYALKHTGNIEYLLSNKGKTDLKWQQMQNRHQTSAMTDRYNRKLGAYFIDADSVKWREL